MNNVIKNIASLLSVHFSNLILPLLLIPHLINSLGLEEYGNIAIAQSVIAVAIVFLDYGFNFTATRSVTLQEGLVDRFNILVNVIICKVIIFSLLLLIFSICYLFYLEEVEFYWVSLLVIAANVFYIPWFYQGMEKMTYIAKITLTARLLSLTPCFFFVSSPGDGVYFMLALAVGAWIPAILSLVKAKQYVSYGKLEITTSSYLKDGFGLFLSRISVSTYTSAVPIIISFFYGASSVGIYSAIEKVIRGVASLQGPFIQAIFPFISKDRRRLSDVLKFYTLPFSMYLIFFVFNIFFPELILSFFNIKGSDDNILLLSLLSFLPVLLSISGFLGVFILLARGENKNFSIAIISGSLSFAALIFLLCGKGMEFQFFPLVSIGTEVVVISVMSFFIIKGKLCPK